MVFAMPACGARVKSEFPCRLSAVRGATCCDGRDTIHCMSLETLVLDKFDGTNYRNPEDELDPSETPKSSNVVIVGDGEGLAMRKGSTRIAGTGTTGWPAWPGAKKLTNMMAWEHTEGAVGWVISLDGDIYAGLVNIDSANLVLRWNVAASSSIPWIFEPADDNIGFPYLWCMTTNGLTTPQKLDGVGMFTDTWLGTPPRGNALKYWRGRMCIGGGTPSAFYERLYFSDLGNPEAWPTNNFVDLRSTSDFTDPIYSFEVLGDDLWVFRKHSVWKVTDPAAFTNEQIFSLGVPNQFCTCESESRIYFATQRGVYSTDGADLIDETHQLDGIDPYTGTNFFEVGGRASSLSSMRLNVGANGHIYWTLAGGYIFEGYPELRGDSGPMPWVQHQLPGVSEITAIAPVPIGIVPTGSPALFFGGDTTDSENFLMKFQSGAYSDFDFTTDTNRKIVTEYWTPWISVDDVDEYARIRKINMLLGELSGVGLELKVDIYADWDKTTALATYSVNTAGSIDRDVMNYWRPETRCRAFALRFYTDAGVTSFKDWELDRIQVKYRGRVASAN
jgi:hypothetical protein